MDEREKIAYLICRFDDLHPGARTRAEYLSCADEILALIYDPAEHPDAVAAVLANQSE
jgi:hypothetical protein